MQAGYIQNLADIYYLKDHQEELVREGAIGKSKGIDKTIDKTIETDGSKHTDKLKKTNKSKSTNNLLEAIERSKDQDIDRLITGLGIQNVGRHAAGILKNHFPDLFSIAAAGYDQLIALDGLGDISAKAIMEFFAQPQNKILLERLEIAGVNMKSKAANKAADTSFEGVTFVLTGTLPTMTREQASELIQKHGGRVTESVSKKTTYLVAGDEAGSKLTKAQSLGIKILTEADLLNMLK